MKRIQEDGWRGYMERMERIQGVGW